MIAYHPIHPDDMLVGSTVDGWHIVARIASSDHAAVFRAECEGSDVAFKICRAGNDPTAARRAEREAEALRRIAHPAVASLIAAGAQRGTPYVVTPWIAGTLFASRIAMGPLTWRELHPILVALCDGLGAIHRADVVHRDLKPSNVILPASGEPAAVILDLGHASVLGDPRITPSGVTVGTDGYMAPEQLAGGKADARSDLYALGVIAYRALTGSAPFSASGAELWRAQRSAAIEPLRKRAPELDVPREAEDLCLWLLAREPSERLPSAAVLAVTLRAVAPGRNV
jgi:serine/threonine-protein kinase